MEELFNSLLAAHGPALLRLASSFTRSAGDRDDLFQDISLAIWKALPRFRGESSDRTFIFRIAHNRAISHLARRRPPASPVEDVDVCDPSPDPETGLLREQRHARLAAAICQLSVEHRQVMTLALEGMSYAEIAQVVGIRESNVGVRLSRARQSLRRLMEEER